jgi:hypothetical protein
MKTFNKIFKHERTGVIIVTVVIFMLETVGYFCIAPYFGIARGGPEAAVNLQLPIDRLIPWCTPLLIVYIPFPVIWVFWVPLLIWLVTGRGKRGNQAFWQYCVISVMMYVAGILIYMIMPTVTIPHDFLDGPIQKLAAGSMFYNTIATIDSSSLNVFGSFPSYHNFWAALFVLFGIVGVKNRNRILGGIVVIYGLAISLSTLMLHQHALLDFVFTYALVCVFYIITVKYALNDKLRAIFVSQ